MMIRVKGQHRETWNNTPYDLEYLEDYVTQAFQKEDTQERSKADANKQIMPFENSCLAGNKLVTNRRNVSD